MQIDKQFSLYPNLKETSIQIFDDSGKGLLPAKILGWDDLEDLEKYNALGYGIFFSVNSMIPGKRDKKSVTRINAWICEMDDFTKETQLIKILECPIMPSMIIESKKSYHLYWFAEDGTKENWEIVGQGLRDYFSGDPAVAKDYSRVLRVPGYNHLKDPNDPYKITLANFEGTKHKEADMMKAYPFEKKEAKKITRKTIVEGDFREILNSWSCTDLLTRLSGTYLVDNDRIDFKKNSNGTYQIFVNDKSTPCWIDNNDLIGSPSEGGPTWINWVLWYGRADNKAIAERAKSNCKDLLPEAVNKPTKKREPLTKAGVKNYTRGIQSVDELLGMPDENDFVIFVGFPFMGKTNYTFFMAEKNARSGIKTVYYTLELNAHTLKKRKAREMAGLTKYQVQTQQYTKEQKEKMNSIYTGFDDIPNFELLGYDRLPSIEDLLGEMQKQADDGVKLFFIDNLGKITGSGNENERFDNITSQLQTFKNNNDVCIVLLHHLNKPSKNEMNEPGGIHKIRGSQKIMDNATIAIEIWRDQDEDGSAHDKKKVLLAQMKDTQGGTIATSTIYFDGGTYTNVFKG